MNLKKTFESPYAIDVKHVMDSIAGLVVMTVMRQCQDIYFHTVENISFAIQTMVFPINRVTCN